MTGNDLAGMLLLLTGAVAPVFSEEEADVFQRGSAGLKSGDQGVGLSRLKCALQESQKKLIPPCNRGVTRFWRARFRRSSNALR